MIETDYDDNILGHNFSRCSNGDMYCPFVV